MGSVENDAECIVKKVEVEEDEIEEIEFELNQLKLKSNLVKF